MKFKLGQRFEFWVECYSFGYHGQDAIVLCVPNNVFSKMLRSAIAKKSKM